MTPTDTDRARQSTQVIVVVVVAAAAAATASFAASSLPNEHQSGSRSPLDCLFACLFVFLSVSVYVGVLNKIQGWTQAKEQLDE